MFGSPQDIVAILAGAALIFGGGGAVVRNAMSKPRDVPDPEPMGTPEDRTPTP
jgi:hypothetical protein